MAVARGPTPSPTSGGSVRASAGRLGRAAADASGAAHASARCERACEVLGQLASARRARRPVTGCANASRAACRNCRRSPYSPAVPYCGIAAHRMADRRHVDADLVRAPGLERDPQQRRRRQQALELEVRPGLARLCRCRSTSAPGRADRGRSARRSCRSAPPGGRRPAPGTRAAAGARTSSAFSARWTASLLATTSSPEVSRSSRCTIPARQTSSPPAAPSGRAPARASRSGGRAPGGPPRRRGLSTTSRYSSS